MFCFSNNNWEKLEAIAATADVSKDEAKFTVKFSIPSKFYNHIRFHQVDSHHMCMFPN